MKRIAIGLAAGFVIAAGGAFAASSVIGSGGVIDGCYKKQTGQLRVVAAAADCDPSEAPLSWNQDGPAGPPGPKGETGERGPSDLFHNDWNVDPIELEPHGGLTTIRTLSLPAGSYFVDAQAEILLAPNEPFPSTGYPACSVNKANDPWPQIAGNFVPLRGPNRFEVVELMGSVTLTEPETIELRCETGGGEIKMKSVGQLLALQVGSVTHEL